MTPAILARYLVDVVCHRCKHQVLLPGSEIATRLRPGETLYDALDRFRCSRCQVRGRPDIRILADTVDPFAISGRQARFPTERS